MKEFTLVDYSAFGLWILISIILSYLLVRKLNVFGGGYKNQKILAILDNSKSITSKYISDFTFREHQLFFHNQQDLNCERHFRIFRQQNTISNKCFSCYLSLIHI